MTFRNAVIRTLVTFVAGALASPIGSAIFNVSFWALAANAGIAAVLNLAYRASQAWLEAHPETFTTSLVDDDGVVQWPGIITVLLGVFLFLGILWLLGFSLGVDGRR